jgi:hypothetical protein
MVRREERSGSGEVEKAGAAGGSSRLIRAAEGANSQSPRDTWGSRKSGPITRLFRRHDGPEESQWETGNPGYLARSEDPYVGNAGAWDSLFGRREGGPAEGGGRGMMMTHIQLALLQAGSSVHSVMGHHSFPDQEREMLLRPAPAAGLGDVTMTCSSMRQTQ